MERAVEEEASNVRTVVVGPDGTEFLLGMLRPAMTILSVKQELARKSHYSPSAQCLFVIEDKRRVENFELMDDERILEAVRYAGSGSKLLLSLVVDVHSDAAEFFKTLRPSATPNLEIKRRGDPQSWPLGVAFVPAHPELLVVTAFRSNQVRVYREQVLLCTLGREDGLREDGLREDGLRDENRPSQNAAVKFESPFGIAVTNSNLVIVTE